MTEREDAIKELNEVLLKCQDVGILLGVTSMYQTRTKNLVVVFTEVTIDKEGLLADSPEQLR